MLLSLLETILVIHLIDKDASQDNEMKKSNCMIEGQEEKLTNLKNSFTGESILSSVLMFSDAHSALVHILKLGHNLLYFQVSRNVPTGHLLTTLQLKEHHPLEKR